MPKAASQKVPEAESHMIPQADRCQGSTGGGSGRSLCRTVGVAALLAAAAGLCGCGKGAEPARTR